MEDIKTAKVQGRRELRYESYGDLVADIKQLSQGEYTTIGNWTFPQIIEHLAVSIATGVDGAPFAAPWIIRKVFKVILKKRFLTKTLSPGFQLPKAARPVMIAPPDTTMETALAHLKDSISRVEATTERKPHGLFENLTAEESDQFHLRHAEMHMSFVVPA